MPDVGVALMKIFKGENRFFDQVFGKNETHLHELVRMTSEMTCPIKTAKRSAHICSNHTSDDLDISGLLNITCRRNYMLPICHLLTYIWKHTLNLKQVVTERTKVLLK